ncbi:MAG TPA: FmdE family protein [Bacteroidales bacterium]|nr:FmdE family protein [Bacteroidales bacterium]HOK74920.1 FmdE family protein [Bacteroidales bacterium]HPP91886.1 FmdE family protein [Bacteroidales bacterium]HQG63501.1 FmdE family protein [Bacteroidales bacterium]HQK71603.1 FmdE family protein [Bacteroidales bacterium]
METRKFHIPDWAFEFHGHKCPFMPIGYRMGTLALNKLGVERCKDHEMHVFSEMGVGHPQGCMQDGIMSATGATFGKGMLDRLYYGKVAAIFWYPGIKGAVRIYVKNEFQDKMAPHEFFAYRKKGIEPSQIPLNVCEDIIDMVLTATDDELFKITELPDFEYKPVKGSFNKAKCENCGEYVFERYLRVKDGKKVCIQCAGHAPDEKVFYHPFIK